MTDHNHTGDTPCTLSSLPQTEGQGGQRVPRRVSWLWLPSLSFSDGVSMAVVVLLLVMLRRFGLNNSQTTLVLALLCIPFSLRPLLEKVVAHFRGTTKVWILTSEFISALALWGVAFVIPTPYRLEGTLCLLPFFTFSIVLHRIAVERFYLPLCPPLPGLHTLIVKLFRGVAMLFGVGCMAMVAGNMEVLTRNIRYSWSFVFYVMAGIFFFLWLWHSIFLPVRPHPAYPESDLFGLHKGEYEEALNGILSGSSNRVSLLLMASFALAASFPLLGIPLFVIDMPHNGGLGMSPQEFALIVGTVSVGAVFFGNVLGTRLCRKYGLRLCLLPMTVLFSGPSLAALYMSFNLSVSLAIVCLLFSIAGVVAGVGFAALSSVTARFAASGRGEVCRRSVMLGVMAVVATLCGGMTGILEENIGYRQFFVMSSWMYVVPAIVAVMYIANDKIRLK